MVSKFHTSEATIFLQHGLRAFVFHLRAPQTVVPDVLEDVLEDMLEDMLDMLEPQESS